MRNVGALMPEEARTRRVSRSIHVPRRTAARTPVVTPRRSWTSTPATASRSVRGIRVAIDVDDGLAHLEALTEVEVHGGAARAARRRRRSRARSPGTLRAQVDEPHPEARVLHRRGSIEAQLLADAGDVGGASLRPGDHARWVARQQHVDREGDRDDRPDDAHAPRESPCDAPQGRSSPPRAARSIQTRVGSTYQTGCSRGPRT